MENAPIPSSIFPEYVRRPLTSEERRHLQMATFLCGDQELTAFICRAFITEGTVIGYVYDHVDQDAANSRCLHEGAIFRSKVLSCAAPIGPFWLLSSEQERLVVLNWEDSFDYATSIEEGVEYVDADVALANRQRLKGFRL